MQTEQYLLILCKRNLSLVQHLCSFDSKNNWNKLSILKQLSLVDKKSLMTTTVLKFNNNV